MLDTKLSAKGHEIFINLIKQVKSMTKVLLVWPPWHRLQNSELKAYPIGLCYLAAVLEKAGVQVKVINADYNEGKEAFHNSELINSYDRYKAVVNDINHPIWHEADVVIEDFQPDILGFTVNTGSVGAVLNISRNAKKINPDIKVIMGGAHPTAQPESTLKNPEVDYIVMREGEQTIVEMVKNFDSQSFAEVLGMGYKDEGNIKINPARPLIDNLDELPFPARHLIVNKETFPPDAFGGIFSSRGCPFSCIYCSSYTLWGKKVRYRSVENVIEEIKQVKKEFKTKHYFFVDDTFSLKIDRAMQLCDRMVEENLEVEWHCQTRVDCVNEELVKKMKAAGCNCILIGVETGDPESMKKIKKAISLDKVRAAAEIFKKCGMPFNTYFMVGFPWETIDQINNTLSFMKEIDPTDASYAVVTPQPGTELYDIVKKEGLLESEDRIDWSTFHHQSMDMFKTHKFSNEEKKKIIQLAEQTFDEQKHRKLREKIKQHPGDVLKRVIEMGYYKNPIALARMGRDILFPKKPELKIMINKPVQELITDKPVEALAVVQTPEKQ